jgi:thiamine biosynthesis protein ThiS
MALGYRARQHQAEHGTSVDIIFNGEPRTIPAETTVAGLLRELKLDGRHVAVEVNLELVPRTRHAEHQLVPGDRLEVVTLVGGG